MRGIRRWVLSKMVRYTAEDPERPLVLAYGSVAPQFTNVMAYEQFAAAGRTEAEQLLAARSERTPQPVATLWRQMVAQHFVTPGGFFRGSARAHGNTNRGVLTPAMLAANANSSACVAHVRAEMEGYQTWNAASETALSGHGVAVVRVWESTWDAAASHVGHGDCTHYCQDGDAVPTLWASALVHELEHALREGRHHQAQH